ncbi:MAG: GcrA family cell cycle regulator [Maricaulaceae bacterium]|jgi:GcrA cell cycle regulator
MSWTDERVEVLKKLWAEGLSASQIAKELGGVTRNAVIGKVHRLGLSGRATPSRPPSRLTSPHRPRAALRPALRLAGGTSAPAAAPSIPVDPAPLPNGEFATVLDLSEHICKWPVGDPSDPNFQFCGRKTKVGAPYCEAHSQMAFQPPKKRRKTAENAEAALDAIAAQRRASW